MKKKKEVVIQNTSTPLLVYAGNVRVVVMKKGRVVKTITNHNAGGNSLFKFVLDCLAGNYFEENRPSWVIPYYVEGDIKKYSISKAIPVYSASVAFSENQYTLSYKCLISALYLTQQTKIDGLLFYSTNNASELPGTDQEVDDSYSMQMAFASNEGEESIFQDQDLLVV